MSTPDQIINRQYNPDPRIQLLFRLKEEHGASKKAKFTRVAIPEYVPWQDPRLRLDVKRYCLYSRAPGTNSSSAGGCDLLYFAKTCR